MKDYRRILITRFSALGDVAMTIPVVYSLCESNRDRNFVFVTKQIPSRLFINTPANLTVIGVETEKYKGVAGTYNLADELKKNYDIDALADLHGSLRTRILSFWLRLMGVKVAAIRKGKRGKRALTRRYKKIMVPLVSTRARYREVFYRLGLPYKEMFKGIFKSDYRVVTPSELLAPVKEKIELPEEEENIKMIGIAPFAAHRGKVYPEEMMERVIKRLSKERNLKIYIFGSGNKEANTIGRWAMMYENIVNMAAAKIGLAAEMALMSRFEMMVSMDSANMHLASLVGTRVVSIWGATHPFCGFMGWHQKKDDALQLDMICRPCSVFGNKPCHRGDFYCMYGLAPERVIEKILGYDDATA